MTFLYDHSHLIWLSILYNSMNFPSFMWKLACWTLVKDIFKQNCSCSISVIYMDLWSNCQSHACKFKNTLRTFCNCTVSNLPTQIAKCHRIIHPLWSRNNVCISWVHNIKSASARLVCSGTMLRNLINHFWNVYSTYILAHFFHWKMIKKNTVLKMSRNEHFGNKLFVKKNK